MRLRQHDPDLADRLPSLDVTALRHLAYIAASHAVTHNPRLEQELEQTLLARMQERLHEPADTNDLDLMEDLSRESDRLDNRYWAERERIPPDDPRWRGSDGEQLFRCARALDAAVFAMMTPTSPDTTDSALYDALAAEEDDEVIATAWRFIRST